MGLIGAESIAAHAIAIQLAALSFMVPMGLSRRRRSGSASPSAAATRAGIARAAGPPSRSARLYVVTGLVMLASLCPVTMFLDPPFPPMKESSRSRCPS